MKKEFQRTFLSRRLWQLLAVVLGGLMLSSCESTYSNFGYDEDVLAFNLKKKQYRSKFGVMSPGPGGAYRVYAETTYIHRNVDKDYVHGFEVTRKDRQRFMGQFEITFPAPIRITPELEKAYIVLEGGKRIRSNAEIQWEIYSAPFWFSEDDPLGIYELKIFIDGELYRTVEYEVVPFAEPEIQF